MSNAWDRLATAYQGARAGAKIDSPAPEKEPDADDGAGPLPSVVDLLEQANVTLDKLRPTSDDDDGLSQLVMALPAAAGRVHLVMRRDRPYVLVPNAPRSLVVGWGQEMANLAGAVGSGGTGVFVLPFADIICVDYEAGAAGDMLRVYASSRPISAPGADAAAPLVAAGDALANPTAPVELAFIHVWDATAQVWRRAQSGTTGGVAGTLVTSYRPGSAHADANSDTVVGIQDFSGTPRRIAVVAGAFNGATWDRPRTPAIFKPIAPTAVVAGVGLTVWTPAAGKKFRLMGWVLSVTVASEVIFGDNAVGTIIARTGIQPANDAKAAPAIGNGILSAAANNVLKIDVTAGATVQGTVYGTEE